MTARKILLAYNHASHDKKALSFVIEAFANREEVQVTLINVYAPLPRIDMASSPEMSKIRDRLAGLQAELEERESVLKSTREQLLQNGFREDQVDYVFKQREHSIPEEILEIAKKKHCDVLVLSGRESGRVSRMLSRSVHERILGSVSGITVCIAK